jgi:hypothetical protein
MKSGKLQSVLVFGAMLITLTACSMEASIQSLVDTIEVLKAPGSAQGITSGSTEAANPTWGSGPNQGTANSAYKVYVSAGPVGGSNLSNNSLVHTTASGYKVFSTVQGAIVSE